MNPIIEVQNLSKLYQIGAKETYSSLREEIMQAITAPFSSLKSNASELTPDTALWALKDVSFEVQEGDVVGIIGRNGAGKSTLLKILSRITEPTSGRITLRGRVSSLLEVGTGFHPELTGRDNIFLNGALLGMSNAEIKAKFDEIVAFSEIEKFLDTPVKRYSSGMYIRLAFAVAAHLEPEILIIDEVLAVGDVQFQKKCLGKMGDVAKGGRTVLFVSHNMVAIQNLCSRCLLFEQGIINGSGNSHDIVNKYLHQMIDSGDKTIRRKGNGSIRFENYFIGNINGERTNLFHMGATLYIYFSLYSNGDIKNSEISIEIKDIYNNSLAHITNEDYSIVINGESGNKQRYCVVIPNVYLTPSNYTISLWSGYFSETYDYLMECMSFEIVQSPKIKRNHYPSHVKYYFPSQWSALDEFGNNI